MQHMKSLRKSNSISQTCSCTSCIYNSESDHRSLQHILLSGSRIDRLYYGKYIPLRERKLLNKLVRTRAVYDDIRAQLVSDSTSSFYKDANFKRKSSASELDDTEKSSAILELVNLVDKGAALKSSRLSECCSCCSCSSKMHIGEHTHKVHRHRHAHGRKYVTEKQRYELKKRKDVRFKAKHIKSDPCTCTFQFSGLANIPPITGYTDNNEDMNIRLRTDKFKEMPKKSLQNIVDSKTNLKNKITAGIKKIQDSKTKLQESVALRANESLEKLKIMKDQLRPNKQLTDNVSHEHDAWLYEDNTKTNRLKKLARSSREKLRSSQTKIKNKIQEGGEIVELQVKKSLEKIKKVKNKIKSVTCKCYESSENISQKQKELALKIKKDSIRKFKDNLNKKQDLKDWACEDDCIQGTCLPEKCYEKLKRRRAYTKKMREKRNRLVSITKMSNREINVSVLPNTSSTGIQAQQNKMHKATKLANKNIKMKKVSTANKGKGRPEGKKRRRSKPRHTLSISSERKGSSRQAVRIGSSFSFNVEFYKDMPNSNIQKTYPIKRTDSEQSSFTQFSRPRSGYKKRTVIKRQKGSQVNTKKSKRDVKRKGYALKRCFCTLKLKPKRRKSISQKSIGTMSSLQSNEVKINSEHETEAGNFQRWKINGNYQYDGLMPYECEPGICVPYKCNPYECLKLQNKRLATNKRFHTKNSYTASSRKTRSTSSATPKARYSKAKQVQSAIIPRRVQALKKNKFKMQPRNVIPKSNRKVVRIGSTFSFNIDFYKTTGQKQHLPKQYKYEGKPDIHSFTVHPKIKELEHVNNVKKIKEKHKKRRIKTSSTGTETKIFCACGTETADKSDNYKKTYSQTTKTGSNLRYFSHLEPYECEPFTCIPGECDPYICLQNIKKRTKEVSLGTIVPESRSTSSYTYFQRRPKDAIVQSKPDTKGRKVSVKTKAAQPVDNKISPPKGSNIRENKLRNAVFVGSTFSFNIEFSKNYTAKKANVQLASSPIPLNIRTKRKVKHKGITLNKTNVDNAVTHIDKIKKVDKSSIVGPMLKRCFCTLNLYKKRKRENDKYNYRNIPKNTKYTVNTAIIKSTIPSNLSLYKNDQELIHDNPYISLHKYLGSQQLTLADTKEGNLLNEISITRSTLHLNPKHVITKQCLEINSDFSVNVELIKKSNSKGKLYLDKTQLQEGIIIENYNSYLKIKERCVDSMDKNETKTGLSRYLNSSFCAMNMQLENKLISNRKLKPYECEPGVCIPGQCDPNECQKLIMKRLQRAFSKTSGTESDSKSITSSQTQQTPYQSHITSVALKPDFMDKRALRSVHRPSDKNRVVRVGSSFSFDVEFYKKHSHDTDIKKYHHIKPQRRSHHKLAKRTKGKQSSIQTKERNNISNYDTHDSGSQSDRQKVKTKTLQDMQRCFCTLKLHKKGKLKQNAKKEAADSLREEITSVKTVSRGQNTKPIKIVRELLPYECEPGICIPGECDPYECLALINKRKYRERGTDTVFLKKRTASNATSSILKKHKSRTVYVQPKRQPIFRSEQVKPNVKSPHNTTRQAVRIGSNFSFNIDFYKNTSPSDNQDRIHKTEKYHTKRKMQISEKTKPKRNRKNITSLTSQSQISQTINVPHTTKSTTVKPFLQRCFCTLQLRNKEKHKAKHEDVKNPPYKSVMTMTEKQLKQVDVKTKVFESHELLPYECEPGVCVPGECDPLICYERIKKRNLKSLGTETTYQRSKSIGSTPKLRKHRHKKIQSQRVDDEPKHIKAGKHTVPRHVVKGEQKQIVRIGSNFSFNVDFFKDTDLNSHKIYNDLEFPTKKYLEEKREMEVSPNISKRHKIIQDKTYLHSDHLQTLKTSKSVKSGIISNVERCFCTLALRKDKTTKNKHYAKEDKIQKRKSRIPAQESVNRNIQTTKSAVSAVSTFFKKCLCVLKLNTKKQAKVTPVVNFEIRPQNRKSRKFEPYECEPGVCMPGECDPYECERRIKKRLLRENATGTQHVKLNTKSSSTPSKPYKSRHVKTKSSKTRPKEFPLIIPNSKSPISLDPKGKKQSVRIGSTFSFDIEFFKDRSTAAPIKISTTYSKDDTRSILAKKVKDTYKSSGQQSIRNEGKNNFSQVAKIKLEPGTTITDPILKRCFCTLQLHKSGARINSQNVRKKNPKQTPTQNKMTSTKNTTTVSYYVRSPYECPPLMCIPNKCNPYICEEKLRKIKLKTGEIVTEERGILNKSVEAQPLLSTKTKKVQAKITGKAPLKSHNKREQGVVEVPRFTNYLNKENRQAAKFGSNFSLNIEFYKELLPSFALDKSDLKTNEYEICDKSNCLNMKNKNLQVLRSNIRNVKSQVEKSQTENKTSNTVNKLKRCFCTLKLQKNKNGRKTTSKPLYPQVIEVRRVEIQKNNQKKTHNVSTKIDDKLLNTKMKKTNSLQKNVDKMTTILPYQPTKFKKNTSKTLLKYNNKLNKKQLKKLSINVTSYGKRLTRKKSKNALFCTKPCPVESKNLTLKQYLCRCADNVLSKSERPMFSVAVSDNNNARKKRKPVKVLPNKKKIIKKTNRPLSDDLKTSYSERQSKRFKEVSKIKTSKSLKLSQSDKNYGSNLDKMVNLKGNQLEAGDNKYKALAPLSMLKKSAMKPTDDNTFVCSKCLAIHNTKKKKKKMKVNFKDTQQLEEKVKSNTKKKKPVTSQLTKISPKTTSKNLCETCAKSIDEKCKYCKVCFQSENQFNRYRGSKIKPSKKWPIKTWIKKILFKDHVKKEKVPKPLFDVYLESDSFSVINKEEVNKKVKQLNKNVSKSKTKSKKHRESCSCCICLGKRGGKSNKVRNQGKKTGKCICGSEICAKKAENMRFNLRPGQGKQPKELQPCVCGSPVCTKESALMLEISKRPGERVCLCKKEMEIRKKRLKDKNQRAYEKRRKVLSKEENEEDSLRRKFRLKENIRLEKSINKNSSDVMLAAESIIDVGKLGVTGISDIIRILYRCVRDPKHTLRTLKSMKDDPSLILKSLKTAYSDSGVASTARRIKKRVQSMQSVKGATELLEQYPATNYLLHIADKDPKKRLRKIKKKRQRERFDFHCNLFMGSLRKRPFLWIYDRCPWFYPHCLSIINVWRQFADLMLFLLAVVVWSPCIFAMEICRAVMCCTLCTG